MAWRNNTFSNHVHVGIRGADRAVAVCDALRPGAAGAAGGVGELAVRRRAASAGCIRRAREIFTRMFPRCGVPDHFGSWEAYADYVDFLLPRRSSIVEHTEIWWSVRPHLAFGTVEMRIMDAQSCAGESTALLALATACAAQAALDHDAGRPARPLPEPADRGELLAGDPPRARRQADRPRRRGGDSRRRRRSSACWSGRADARAELSLDEHLGDLGSLLANGNGAQRQRRRHEAGEPMRGRLRRDRRRHPRHLRDRRRGAGGALRGGDADEPRARARHGRPRAGSRAQSEEELRAQLEEELRRITVRDVLLQTVVSLVNLGGQRLGLAPGTEDMRDLDQARLAIEGVRALLPLVEEQDAEQVRPIRDALSQLQLAYAQLAGRADAAEPGAPGGGSRPEQRGRPRRGARQRPGGAGGLWVPPGSGG